MRKLFSKNTLIISLLLIVVFFAGNYVQMTRAQGPITSGFYFLRRPPVPDHIKEGAREGLILEINRLTMLSTIPLGDPDVTDYVGNPIVWDQAQLDAVTAEIARLQLLLDEF